MNDAILQVSNIVYRPMYKWTPLPNPTPTHEVNKLNTKKANETLGVTCIIHCAMAAYHVEYTMAKCTM